MPELPEVETTRRGIAPHVTDRPIRKLVVRQSSLRWPIPGTLAKRLRKTQITRVGRRGKYLLLSVDAGTLIIHLGMSGSLRILRQATAPGTHDHVDLVFDDGSLLRYTDPRRFGAWLWTSSPPQKHKLLAGLGPEPLSDAFNADYLHRQAKGRSLAVKNYIMNSRIVVGAGNIYANEALFRAGIHPARAAGRISLQRYSALVDSLKSVLEEAIRQGGTTLRDFVGGEGKPGYFKQQLQVYGRRDMPCPNCGAGIREIRLGQRSTFYCGQCQR